MADGYRDVPVFWLPPHKYEGYRKPDIVCRFPVPLLPKGNILPLTDPFSLRINAFWITGTNTFYLLQKWTFTQRRFVTATTFL